MTIELIDINIIYGRKPDRSNTCQEAHPILLTGVPLLSGVDR